MKKIISALTAFALTSAIGVTAFAASPDVYIVNFRSDQDNQSITLESTLASALPLVNSKYELVTIDTSNPAKWEKSAHEAFDRQIVPVFNQWVGLPGFAAIVDARSKRVIGCVNGQFGAGEMARELNALSAKASGNAYISKASTTQRSTSCPKAYNVDTGE